MKFNGVFVAHTTPFDAQNKLDLIALKKHLEFLRDSGVHGFVPCGTTGESVTLSRAERGQVIESAMQVAASKNLKVIAGCGSNNTEAALELIKEAKVLGVDAALVVTPYYNKPNQRGLIAHYTYLADKANFPIILYNVPSRTNVNLLPETVLELLKHPHIVGIKEATGNYSQWVEMSLSPLIEKNSFMTGDCDAFAPMMALGGCGIISASANVIPKEIVSIYNAALKGDFVEAFRLQKKIIPVVRALFKETNPAPVKKALELTLNIPSFLRLPMVDVTKETTTLLRQTLSQLEVLD